MKKRRKKKKSRVIVHPQLKIAQRINKYKIVTVVIKKKGR
jgi:hypothetical protein